MTSLAAMTARVRDHAMTVAVVVTTVVIIVFAGLQYRWNADVTEATGVRLADTLQMSIVNWHLDLARNFGEVERTFRLPAGADWRDAGRWSDQFEEWKGLSRYPNLVDAVYVLDRDAAPGRLLRLNTSLRRFDPAAWPARATAIRQVAVPADSRWRFAPSTPALVRALEPGGPDASLALIPLSPTVLQDRILPDLAHRYFQGTDGLDYEVAVVAGRQTRRVIYASDAGFGSDEVGDADGTLDIFGQARADAPTPSIRVFRKTVAPVSIDWMPLLDGTTEAEAWQLVVRHRRGGPLGAFLATTYRRDLYVSAAALVLLVASIVMLVVTSSRAQKLAALQMDFVTTVSHELRTPLTVIRSAADNITQGVVEDADQVRRYGSVIGHQVRQLSTLVEQILLFASRGRHPQQFVLRPLRVTDILDATLASTTHLIDAAHFTVTREVPEGLPAVMGDLVAVSQCLQNFIVNALKYGRNQPWIGLSAAGASGPDGAEVRIAVADRGIGIGPEDLPHIFEPFFRSASATRAQIHGTGLGLAVAQELALALGGRITVHSEVGVGSTFVLHLPVAAAQSSRP